LNQFTDLQISGNLHAALGENLKRHNFVTPTPVQAGAIPPALEGRDVVATAQTGTGKTLAFALPIVQKLIDAKVKGPVRAVVLSPTRELAMQIEETFQRLTPGTPVRTAIVVGGMSEFKQLQTLRRGAQVIIATPGRLEDFLRRRLVKLDQVETVVLDEADRMLDMGFLPAIKDILSATPAARQTLLFSATIEPSVAHLIADYVSDPVRIAIGSTTKPAEQVDLHRYEISGSEKLPLLHNLLSSSEGSFLVFVRTKHGADRLADQLKDTGIDATRIHGNRTQAQRNQALEGFKRGTYRVMVATDVAARGIHVDGISHVVNFDLPQAPEDFIHRIGRTGRAGARGIATTFSTKNERNEIRRIERTLSLKIEVREVPKLKAPALREWKPAQVVEPVRKAVQAQRRLPAEQLKASESRPARRPVTSAEFREALLAQEAAPPATFADRHHAQKQKAVQKLKAKKTFQKKIAFAKRKKFAKAR
jgi:ATP-dependent RNA helicase RhlE